MKILMLSWRDPKHPLAGGAEQVMHEHAKGWIKAGHEVTLFSSMFKGAERIEILDKVKILRGGFQILGVHFFAFFWYIFSKQKFDLVVDQFHGIPFFTPLFVRTKKLAVVQETAREVWFLNHLPFPLNYLIGMVGFILEPFIFLIYKNIPFMTGSESAKKDLCNMRIPIKNITVIPHGVILEKSSKKYAKEKINTIIFLGALAHDKGIEDALKAFSILNTIGSFQYWVVGKGSPEYTFILKNKARKLRIEKNLKFWGFVSQEKKFELLQRAHLLINPSIREGWGLVNIEANAMGIPVVAYNSPGLVDSIKNGVSGKMCLANTPQVLADLISEIILNKPEYERLSMSSIIWSNNFSWDKSQKLSNQLICKISNVC